MANVVADYAAEGVVVRAKTSQFVKPAARPGRILEVTRFVEARKRVVHGKNERRDNDKSLLRDGETESRKY